MPKIRMTRNAIAAGEPRQVGDIVECGEAEANALVAIRKAVAVVGAAAKPRSGGLTTETAGAIVPAKGAKKARGK